MDRGGVSTHPASPEWQTLKSTYMDSKSQAKLKTSDDKNATEKSKRLMRRNLKHMSVQWKCIQVDVKLNVYAQSLFRE